MVQLSRSCFVDDWENKEPFQLIITWIPYVDLRPYPILFPLLLDMQHVLLTGQAPLISKG